MQTAWSNRFHIRPLLASDVQAVAEIELQYPSSWHEEEILSELRRDDCLNAVICSSDQIVGWLCCRILAPEAELLKIAVCTSHQRQGLATVLVNYLLDSLTAQAVFHLFLEVRALNRAALEFYQRCGFTEVGRRIKYYRQPQDDALQLRKKLAPPKSKKEQQP